MNATVEIAEVIEAALDGLGVPWKRRDAGWLVPAGPRWPCEVALAANNQGLRVEAVLASWDEIGPAERSALQLLLDRARVAGVRFGLGDGKALAWAELAGGISERAVTGAVSRVEAAARLLTREAGALLSAEVADAYLDFFGARGERLPGGARM